MSWLLWMLVGILAIVWLYICARVVTGAILRTLKQFKELSDGKKQQDKR